MTDNIFNAPPPVVDPSKDDNDNEVYLDKLVGDGKKFKDVEALARAKAESDAFIEQLKREAEELRRDLSTRTSLEKFLEDQAKRTNIGGNPPPEPQENEPSGEQPNIKSISKDEVMHLVTEALSLEQTKTTRLNNTREAVVALQKAWGDNYVAILKSKAVELGITEDWLNDIAARSPKALLALVGANQKPQNNPNQVNPPTSVMRSGVSLNNYSGERNSAYWENMRRLDNKKYHSKDMAILRHSDAIRLGDSF